MYRLRSGIFHNLQRHISILETRRHHRRGQSGQLCHSKGHSDISEHDSMVRTQRYAGFTASAGEGGD